MICFLGSFDSQEKRDSGVLSSLASKYCGGMNMDDEPPEEAFQKPQKKAAGKKKAK